MRRNADQGSITFAPLVRRLELEVIDPVSAVRAVLLDDVGPTDMPGVEALREVANAMTRHLNAGEHELALAAYKTVENRLDSARNDPVRGPLVERTEGLARDAKILRDFQKQDIKIEGVAIIVGQPPIALINGKALGEGDLVNDELIIGTIQPGEIEFIFRGVVLLRRF
jgi:hypothetical protein